MILCTRESNLKRITWCKEKCNAKNLPKALTAVLSPSRSANRARHGSSSRHGRSRRRGGVAIAARVCSLSFPPLFFFFSINGVGTRPRKERVCSLTLTMRHQEGKNPVAHKHPSPLVFFFLSTPPKAWADWAQHNSIRHQEWHLLRKKFKQTSPKMRGHAKKKNKRNQNYKWEL